MTKKEFLTSLFKIFEDKGYRYFVLGEYQSLPEDTGGSDIDIVVEKEEAMQAYTSLKSHAAGNGIILASEFSNAIGRFLRFITPEWGVQIDIFCGGVFWEAAPYYDMKYIRPHVIEHNGIKVLCKAKGFYIDYFKEIVHNGKSKEKYRLAVLEAFSTNAEECREEITAMYGREATDLITGHLNLDGLNEIGKPLRAIMRQKLQSEHRFSILKSKVSKVTRLLQKRPGYVIAVLGTDGSGKSFIINSVTPWLDECFHGGVKYNHLRPKFIPDIAELTGKRKKVKAEDKPKVVSNPHAQKPSGLAGSLFRLGYYMVDYTVGYFAKVWTRTHTKSDFFIFDRYYYDYYLDQRRAHMSLPNWILRIGELLVPSPDLTLCLGGDPDKIYARKPETSLEEVSRQTLVLKEFCRKHSNAVWVDTTMKPEESIEAAKNAIMNVLKK